MCLNLFGNLPKQTQQDLTAISRSLVSMATGCSSSDVWWNEVSFVPIDPVLHHWRDSESSGSHTSISVCWQFKISHHGYRQIVRQTEVHTHTLTVCAVSKEFSAKKDRSNESRGEDYHGNHSLHQNILAIFTTIKAWHIEMLHIGFGQRNE